jgi:serine/threonine protein kinase
MKHSDFLIKETLSTTPATTVYRGVHESTKWAIVIKEFNPEVDGEGAPQFFQREVEILLQCNNPFLIPFLGFTAEAPFSILTEYMVQGSLGRILQEYPTGMNGCQRTSIALGVACGMRYLHSRGIMHGNLKCENVLLDCDLLPRIGGFSHGRVTGSAVAPLVTKGVGSPQWMAPEQLSSDTYGLPVDVYSYGLVLSHLLTGKEPFEGVPDVQVAKMILAGQRPAIPADLENTPIAGLIRRCWDSQPEQRPAFEEIYQLFLNQMVGFPRVRGSAFEQMTRRVTHTEVWHCGVYGFELAQIAAEKQKVPHNQAAEQMWRAAESGDVPGFAKWLTLLPDMNVNLRNESGLTALHFAVIGGQHDIVLLLLEFPTLDLNCVDEQGETPLIMAAKRNKLRMAELLLQNKRVRVNMKDKLGNTALHHAVIKGAIDMVKRLMQRAAVSLAVKNQAGQMPIDIAQQAGSAALQKVLMPME